MPKKEKQWMKILPFVHILVGGMTCTGCVTTLESHLKKIGVISVKASLLNNKAIIEYSSQKMEASFIADEIKKLNFTADIIPDASTCTIRLDLKDWTEFTQRSNELENSLTKKEGVIQSFISKEQDCFIVTLDPDQIGPRDIVTFLEKKFGHSFRLTNGEKQNLVDASDLEKQKWRKYFWICLVLTIPIAFISFIFPSIPQADQVFSKILVGSLTVGNLIQFILTIPIQFGAGLDLYKSGWNSLYYGRQASMDVLIMLSTTTAFVYSCITFIVGFFIQDYDGEVFFETSAILLTLIILGRYLENIAKKRTNQVMVKLQKLQTPVAILFESDQEREIDMNLIQRGDILKIYPGSQIPTDGLVISGETYIVTILLKNFTFM